MKVKLTQQQEFVIGGYTPPEGSRKYFGALLVGYCGPEGLLFAGRVGTGFSERALAALYEGMQKIRRKTCPFVNLPEKRPGRWGQGITPAVLKRCHWVEPVLVQPGYMSGAVLFCGTLAGCFGVEIARLRAVRLACWVPGWTTSAARRT